MSSQELKKEHVNETQKSFLPNHLRPLTYKKKDEINFYFNSYYRIVKNLDNKKHSIGSISYYGLFTARRIIEVPLTMQLQKTSTAGLREFKVTKDECNSKSTNWFFNSKKKRVVLFKINYEFLDETGKIIEVKSKGTKTGKAMTTNEDDEDEKDLFLQHFYSL